MDADQTSSRTPSLSRGVTLGTAWQVLRAGSYLLWVAVVARLLGPEGYGQLAGAMGLATAIGTLSGFGLGLVMLLDVPRQPRIFSASWTRAMRATLLSGAVLTIVFATVAPHAMGQRTAFTVLLAVGVSEVICFPVAVLCSYALQSHERMGWGHAVYALLPVASLVAALSCRILVPNAQLETYVLFHAAASVAAAAIMTLAVRRLLRPVAGSGVRPTADVRRGIELAVVRSADIALNTLDKTLMLRLGGGEMAGIYAVASRLAAALALPIVTLSSAALPRLSRAAAKPDSTDARHLAGKLVVAAVAWGIAAAVGMAVLGSVLPLILGARFTAAAELAVLLAPLPLLIGLCSLGCTVLLTSERQRLRLAVQLGGIAILIAASAILVPAYGLRGSAGAVLITQASTAAGLWLTVGWSRSRVAADRSGSN